MLVGALIGAAAATLAVPSVASAANSARHVELVTPVEKLGQAVRFGAVSPDGQTVLFDTDPGNGLPDDPSHYSNRNSNAARRTPSGWVSRSWNLPATDFAGASSGFEDATPDFSTQLFNLSTPEQNRNAESAYYLRRSPNDPPERISPVLRNREGATPNWRPRYSGTTPDLSHILLNTIRPNTLRDEDLPFGDGATYGGTNLYEIAGAGTPQAVLRRVDVDNAGQQIGTICGAFFGAKEARRDGTISADGRRIFFSAVPGAVDLFCGAATSGPPIRIFARVDGTSTVELSASECDRTPDPGADPPIAACTPLTADALYESASADGRRVWFSTTNQLVDSDVDGDRDLYVYDFDAPNSQQLTQVSSRTGATAGVQTLVRASADGSRAYFLAAGVLASNENAQHATAVDGQSNLYLYNADADETTFVATIDAGDAAQWATGVDDFRRAQLADDDGRILVFSTVAPVTADDTDAVSDVFRFDAEGQSLSRVSTGQPGRGNDDTGPAEIIGNGLTDAARQAGRNRTVSRDGSRIMFFTPERLADADHNELRDAYEWHDGETQLVSDGRPPERGQERFLLTAMMSEDGGTIVFTTPRALVPQDRDTGTDIYAARLGDDVTIPIEPETPVCVGAACQGPGAPTADPPAPQTPLFAGPGNVVPSPTVTASAPRVKKPGAVKGSRVTLRVTVAGAGRLTTAGSGLRSTAKKVTKAGTYAVRVPLTKRATSTLKRKGQVRVTVRVTFTAKGGTPAVARTSVTFKRTKKQAPAKRSAS